MLFQLPIDADTTVLDKGIYVDEGTEFTDEYIARLSIYTATA